MKCWGKWSIAILLLVILTGCWVPVVNADNIADTYHEQALVPTDCTACHEGYGIVTEHVERLSYSCSACHGNLDQDVIDTIYRGRYDHLPVYCAFCHLTENMTTHVHDDGMGHVEHDHALVPIYCRGCHGNDIREVHIDPTENDLDVKLSCYTCHSGSSQPGNDPLVRSVVDQGMAGSDVSCEACHPGYHSADHNHAVIPPGNCTDCHSANVVTEHLDNQGLECATCHNNTDQAVQDAINSGVGPNGNDVDCYACHPSTDHAGAHDHAVITAPFCAECHDADISTEHITNHGLECATCHNSGDPDVVNAINTGMAGTDVNCDSCHGMTDHTGAHDHAVITPGGCSDCHSADINVEHIDNHGLDCSTCHESGDPLVVDAIAAGRAGVDVDCQSCHGVVDHAGVHDHAVITPGICIDCHADNVVEEHITNHGLDCTICHNSSDPDVINAINTGIAGTDVDCNACHGVVDHAAAHDHAVLTDGDCGRCHSASIVREHAAHGINDCSTCHDSSDPVVSGAIADGMAGTDIACDVCHPGAAAWHETAHDHIYLRTKVAGLESIITSGDDPSDGFYDDLPAYRPSLTCGICHAGIAENHWGNFHSGLRLDDMFDASGTPLARGVLDPSRPWVSGPGMFGNWCPSYNRQLPDLNATFADEAEFTAQVDLGVFEFIRECGSCHVGGGPGVENSFGFAGFASLDLDDPVRATALDSNSVPLNPWDFYIENDTVVRGDWAANGVLDVDCLVCHLQGYDNLARNAEVRGAARFGAAAPVGAGLATVDAADPDQLDYLATMVAKDGSNQLYLSTNITQRLAGQPLSENCLACHMPDMVMHENEAVNGDLWQNHFYSAAAVPSDDPGNPDPLVAANKKPALYRNEMLKRGATWRRDAAHKVVGCSGCHSRTGKTQAYNPVSAAASYLHSPGKGFDPLKYPSAADGTVKLCEDCHVHYGYLDDDGQQDFLDFAPPEMQVRHAQSGLLANIVPTARRIADAAGSEETFMGNHLDVLSCTACHVQKRYAAARLVDYSTGGRYYNFTGTPADQVPSGESVQLAYTWKENTTKKLIDGQPNPEWRRQIFPFNYLTSSYWDNIGSADANGDGFHAGDSNAGYTVIGDPFFQRTIKDQFNFDYVNGANDRVASGLAGVLALDERAEWAMASQDGSVLFSNGSEIDAFQAVLGTVNPGYDPRLTLESRPFLVVHNIMPIRSGVGLSGGASYALGAPDRDALGQVTAYGCNDCHGGGGGVFNGTLSMLGKGRRISDNAEIPLTISWNDAGDVRAMAFAWNNLGNSFIVDFSSGTQTRDSQRWEFLGYDAGRVAALNAVVPATFGLGVAPVAEIASINGVAATVPRIDLEVGTTAELVATAAGLAGSFQYRWNVNDEPGMLTGQTVSKTFDHTGLWNVMLTVIDEEGRLTQDVQQVNVTNPDPSTLVQVSTTAGSPGVTLSLSNLPVHTQIKFYFGDGTREYINDSSGTYTLLREFRLRDMFLNAAGDTWEYTTSIRIYNGDETVAVINVRVSVPVL